MLADEWENRANLRVNAVVPGPINSPLRGQTHPGEERAALPDPASLVPLYLHLLGAQPKSESGVADRRAGVARGSAGIDAAAAGAAHRRAAVAQHHAQPAEIVGGERVGSISSVRARQRAVGAPDDRRERGPT